MGELHDAAQANDVAQVRALVAAGANVNETDERGCTPLFYAVNSECVEAMVALLGLGADVHRWDGRGEPLMHYAAEGGSPGTIGLLLQAGADVNQSNPHGWTGLHEAALLARPDIAWEFLAAGANLDAVDDETGMKPLLVAAGRLGSDELPYTDVARLLLEHGADPNAADAQVTTALEMAVGNEDPELVGLLLARGATHTPRSAARLGDLAAVERLLAGGTDPNARDYYGSTTLHDSIRHLGVAVVLLHHGADPRARDSYGETPLHIWAQVGTDAAVASALVEAGAEVNARNVYGETPIYLTGLLDNPEAATVLLRLGADPMIPNCDGETPIEVARRQGHDDVVRVIENAMSANPKGDDPHVH